MYYPYIKGIPDMRKMPDQIRDYEYYRFWSEVLATYLFFADFFEMLYYFPFISVFIFYYFFYLSYGIFGFLFLFFIKYFLPILICFLLLIVIFYLFFIRSFSYNFFINLFYWFYNTGLDILFYMFWVFYNFIWVYLLCLFFIENSWFFYFFGNFAILAIPYAIYLYLRVIIKNYRKARINIFQGNFPMSLRNYRRQIKVYKKSSKYRAYSCDNFICDYSGIFNKKIANIYLRDFYKFKSISKGKGSRSFVKSYKYFSDLEFNFFFVRFYWYLGSVFLNSNFNASFYNKIKGLNMKYVSKNVYKFPNDNFFRFLNFKSNLNANLFYSFVADLNSSQFNCFTEDYFNLFAFVSKHDWLSYKAAFPGQLYSFPFSYKDIKDNSAFFSFIVPDSYVPFSHNKSGIISNFFKDQYFFKKYSFNYRLKFDNNILFFKSFNLFSFFFDHNIWVKKRGGLNKFYLGRKKFIKNYMKYMPSISWYKRRIYNNYKWLLRKGNKF